MKALDEIYKMYTYASLGEKNQIENEIMKMYTNKKYRTHFCTLGFQSENQEKRFWQVSFGRSTRARRRSHQAAAEQRGREEYRKECAQCTLL